MPGTDGDVSGMANAAGMRVSAARPCALSAGRSLAAAQETAATTSARADHLRMATSYAPSGRRRADPALAARSHKLTEWAPARRAIGAYSSAEPRVAMQRARGTGM